MMKIDAIRNKISELLDPYPEAKLMARSLYYRKRIIKGIRLRCYAKGKCLFENYEDLSARDSKVEIETLYTCLNTGTEKAMFLRLPNTRSEFPYTPVSSGVGVVRRTGENVKIFKKGDIVAGSMQHCSAFTVSEKNLLKIPTEIDIETASLLHLAIIAMHGIRMGQIAKGHRVAVLGQGIIGRLAAMLARAQEVNDITCITINRDKLKDLGEYRTIALNDQGSQNLLEELNADVVIDATGNPEAIHTAMKAAKKSGRVVLLGSSRGLTRKFDVNGLPMEKELSIVGSHIRNQSLMPSHLGKDYIGEGLEVIRLYQEGKLPLEKAITNRVLCTDLPGYYMKDLPERKDQCGVCVDWSKSEEVFQENNKSLKISYTTPWKIEKPIDIVLVGCGDIGVIDAAAIVKSKGCNLVAVMDVDENLARNLGEKYSLPYTSNLDEILSDRKIEAVFIAVPHYLHAPLSVKAANAGKHVIIEKPMAITMEEGSNMIRVAQENKILLKTFFPQIYEPQITMARELIEHDTIGNPMGISITMHRSRPLKYWSGGSSHRSMSNWRLLKEKSGGGFLIMNLIHIFDCLRYLTGIRIKSVFANYDTLLHPVEVEDTIGMTFRGSKGEIGTVSAGSAVKGHGGSELRIWGENGQILIEKENLRFYSLRRIGEFHAQKWHTINTWPKLDSRVLFLEQYARKISEGEQTSFDEPGYLSLGVVISAYKSGEINQPVEVDSVFPKSITNEDKSQ